MTLGIFSLFLIEGLSRAQRRLTPWDYRSAPE